MISIHKKPFYSSDSVQKVLGMFLAEAFSLLGYLDL